MTDSITLEYFLKKSGITKLMYAAKLGISLQALYNKLNNDSEFKQSEITTTCEILRLSNRERDKIFFNTDVDK